MSAFRNNCKPPSRFTCNASISLSSTLMLYDRVCCFIEPFLRLGEFALPFRTLINFKRHISYYEIKACSRGKVAEHAFQIFQDCIGIQCWSATPQGRLSC